MQSIGDKSNVMHQSSFEEPTWITVSILKESSSIWMLLLRLNSRNQEWEVEALRVLTLVLVRLELVLLKLHHPVNKLFS